MKPEIRNANPGFDRRSIPAEAVESFWAASDAHRIRRIDWPGAGSALRGSLLFMPGRGDYYEKYLETLQYWHCSGWRVTAADWRGQSGSGRLGRDQATGHIDDFGIWVDDLSNLWAEWQASTKGPHVLVGHSMGGHLVLRGLAEKRVVPDALVAIAPMLSLQPGFGFIPTSWLHGIARFLASRGDSRRSAWRGKERPGWAETSRMERLTHDLKRYEDEIWWREKRPELDLGAPSLGWIEAALRSIRLIESPGYLEAIDRPVLIVATEADLLVEYSAIEQAAARIPAAQLETFGEEARHELLREVDEVRDKVLTLIDRFFDSCAPAES